MRSRPPTPRELVSLRRHEKGLGHENPPRWHRPPERVVVAVRAGWRRRWHENDCPAGHTHNMAEDPYIKGKDIEQLLDDLGGIAQPGSVRHEPSR